MENLLNNINLSLNDIEKQLKKQELSFINIKRNDVEYNIKFPIFVESFYDYILVENEIPTQQQFYNYYLKKNQNIQNIQNLDIDQLEGLRARLYRTHPSVIRDLHFAKLLKKKTPIDNVIYNIALDVQDGIDILLVENDFKYALALYINTSRSKKQRVKKIDKRNDKDNYIYIELPLNSKGSRKIGDFIVYGKREMLKILNIILETQKKVG